MPLRNFHQFRESWFYGSAGMTLLFMKLNKAYANFVELSSYIFLKFSLNYLIKCNYLSKNGRPSIFTFNSLLCGKQGKILNIQPLYCSIIFQHYQQLMKFSKTPSISFFTSWYVIVNSLLIFSYPVMRLFTSVGNRDLRTLDSFGFTYENSIIYSGLVFILVYYLRSASLRQFLLDCLTIGKIMVISLLFFAKIKLCMYYSIISFLLWLVIPYPKFTGRNKFIKIQSLQHFNEVVGQVLNEKVVRDGQNLETYQYKNKKMFFIEFYVDWVYMCNTSKQLWYEYSYLYTTPQLKFVQVNLTRFPQLAKRFNINVSGFSKQLPTIVILQNGAESARFPPIKQNNKVQRVIKLDYKILLKYFDLESRYLQTREVKKRKSQ